MKNTILLLTCLTLIACGESNPSTHQIAEEIEADGIVGAERYATSDPGFKATVSLWRYGSVFCTGTLIDLRIVLTAAHCFKNIDASSTEVRFADGTLTWAQDLITHHGFISRGTERNTFSIRSVDSDDIALISLAQNAPSSAKIASLPIGPFKPGKYKVRAFGVGLTSSKASDSGTMRMVNIQGEIRKDRIKKIIYDQSNGKGLCKGDSGGPQFMYTTKGNPIVVAVTTAIDKVPAFFGRPVGDLCRADAVSTLVGHYLEWIAKSKKELQKRLKSEF